MKIERVDTVFLWVSDLDRSVAWYRDRLGMDPGPRFGAWQVMQVGGETAFALHEGSGPHDSVNAVVGFRVADLDAAIGALTADGTMPVDEEITDTGTRRFTTFADPDGNHVQLISLV